MTRPVRQQLIYAEVRILELLPDEGTMTGTFRELGWPVREIHKTLKGEGDITAGQVNGLCKSLNQRGLVTQVQLLPRGQGLGYQITKKGKGELREYNELKRDLVEKSRSRALENQD